MTSIPDSLPDPPPGTGGPSGASGLAGSPADAGGAEDRAGRASPAPVPLDLPSLAEALAAIATAIEPLPPDTHAGHHHGRTLAADVHAEVDAPPFDNAAMDGIAVRAADTAPSPARLRLVGEARAGAAASGRLGPGEAVRISTGAPLPAGADAVVRSERLAGEPAGRQVEVTEAVAPGEDVRRAGEDVRAGALLLSAGTRVGSGEIALLAMAAPARLAWLPRPQVKVLVTGDELLTGGQAGARQVNRPMLEAMAGELGGTVGMGAVIRDDPAFQARKLRGAIERADLVVMAGGMGAGRHDHASAAFEAAGVRTIFRRVALRPGRPARFGVAEDGTPVLGLPGNPAAAFVCMRLLGGAALAALRGAPPPERVPAALDGPPPDPRPGVTTVLRCRAEQRGGGWVATPLEAQGAHQTVSLAQADALALVAPSGGVELDLLGR